MKRFLLQILACMMILLACTESTLAYNNTFDLYNPLEIGPHCGLDANNDSQLDNSTILDIINQMILENINTYNPSKNELEQAYRIINMYDNIIKIKMSN